MPHKIVKREERDSPEGAEASSYSITVGGQDMYAVEPLSSCPHLVGVESVPSSGLDVTVPCEQCEDAEENWVCLCCYKVFCGRYRNKHMLNHFDDTCHALTLSFSDLSAWCYECESYVHNDVLTPAKEAAFKSKFGDS